MAFDGLFTRAMVHELGVLEGGRISRIHQPNIHEVIFTVRANRKNYRLLTSIHPSYSRIHFTEEAITNPPEPPMFCMVLRKHLEGGFVTAVEQYENDRILILSIRSKNEIGDDIEWKLYTEIMGRHSNMMLVDPERNMIVDSLKHLPPSVNSYRTVLPGRAYIPAPPQDKINPFAVSESQFLEIVPSIETGRDFVRTFSGFSPINGEELLYRLQTIQDVSPYEIFQSFLASFQTDDVQPNIAEKDGRMVFSATLLKHVGKKVTAFETLSELLDTFYFERAKRERVRSQTADLERWLNNEIAKTKAKMKKLEKEQIAAKKLDTYQLYGELLTASSYAIEKGAFEATVDNYYEQGTQITIPLDSQKTAIENAQRYFARYSKAKNALVMIAEQLKIAKEDIDYFEILKQQVLQASPDDIAEIREELNDLGYMKARGRNKRKKNKRPKAEIYHSSSGIPISVGKNNKQNDYLTFKVAARSHIWLHTKDMPGSHVVIHHDTPDEETLNEAAILAAYFSKGRDSSSVPVDYTEVRHVKKPNGSKPGFVIYFEQKTLFVTPEEDIVRKLFGPAK